MRKYEIDHLRVIAFLILILYHVSLFFSPWEYRMKNNEISSSFLTPMFFVSQWRLDLLFVISGMGTFFSISRRTTVGFIKERFIRLFIPLLFGTFFIIIPIQIYMERLAAGDEYSSFFEFYFNDLFKGTTINGGYFTFRHLWFILYLFIYSIALALIKKGMDLFSDFFNKYILSNQKWAWITFFLVCIPTFLLTLLLEPIFPFKSHLIIKDWFCVFDYFWFFLCGYLFAKNMEYMWPLFSRLKYVAFFSGILTFYIYGDTFVQNLNNVYIQSIFRSLNVWCWIFAIVGLGIEFLNKKTKWLSYANEAVYPFYIMHQTVLLIIGYYVRELDWNILSKFCFMALGTFFICWILYEFLIRRFNILRFLFGMKPLPSKN